jgi:NAD(P)-dependent dehydrogenase (short-subunit alcohol dehydrogenase family)
MPVALVTGASQGLGRALARTLVTTGWTVVVDARDARALRDAFADLAPTHVVTIPGDVTDGDHRQRLREEIERIGGLDLLVNNASHLGPSPLPTLADYPLADLQRVLDVDVLAPLAVVQALLPHLRSRAGIIVNVSSDAAIQAYAGWGGYGSAKAALDQLSAVLAVEEPDLRVYAVDPGDMRTAMHQQAFPGEDISDRPEAERVVPAFRWLLEQRPPSGRYRAADLGPGSADVTPDLTTAAATR